MTPPTPPRRSPPSPFSPDLGGGQSRVTVVIESTTTEEAPELLRRGFTLAGRGGRFTSPLFVHCIKKQPKPPWRDASREELLEIRVTGEQQWRRIKREYKILEKAAGANTPLPLRRDRTDPDLEPWDHAIYMEYIPGSPLSLLVDMGFPFSDEEITSVAVALFDCLGGADGTSGIHGAGIAHRDLGLDQILIPTRNGTPRFDEPILVDFGFAYHPDIPLYDGETDASEFTSLIGEKPGITPPERDHLRLSSRPPTGSRLLDEILDPHPDDPVAFRRKRLAFAQAQDLWHWGMVIGRLTTGRNIWERRVDEDGVLRGNQAWRRAQRFEDVAPPLIGEVPAALREAVRHALHPNPDHRDRARIARALPPTREDAVLLDLRATIEDQRAHAIESERSINTFRAETNRLKAELQNVRELQHADAERLLNANRRLKAELDTARTQIRSDADRAADHRFKGDLHGGAERSVAHPRTSGPEPARLRARIGSTEAMPSTPHPHVTEAPPRAILPNRHTPPAPMSPTVPHDPHRSGEEPPAHPRPSGGLPADAAPTLVDSAVGFTTALIAIPVAVVAILLAAGSTRTGIAEEGWLIRGPVLGVAALLTLTASGLAGRAVLLELPAWRQIVRPRSDHGLLRDRRRTIAWGLLVLLLVVVTIAILVLGITLSDVFADTPTTPQATPHPTIPITEVTHA